MRDFTLREEDVEKISGETGETMFFQDYLTGEDIVYRLKKGDELTLYSCPLDETSLVYNVIPQVKGFYRCPNCENVYEDPDMESMLKVKEDFLERVEKRLEKIGEEKKGLANLLKKHGRE